MAKVKKAEKLQMKITAEGQDLNIYLYSEIKGDGYDWWKDETKPSETSANTIRDAILSNPKCNHINLYINSDGGSVKEGYGIYCQLKRFQGDITAYIDGFANSISSVIAMAADHVVMYKNSVMIIHNMMTYVYGNAEDLRKAADELDELMVGNRQIYLDKSQGKISEEELIELLNAETVLTAERCLEYGFCDEVVNLAAPEDKNSRLTNEQQIVRLEKAEQAYRQAIEHYNKAMFQKTNPGYNLEMILKKYL